MNNSKECKQQLLVNQIKETGKFIEENADKLIVDIDHRMKFKIILEFPSENDTSDIPTIKIKQEYINDSAVKTIINEQQNNIVSTNYTFDKFSHYTHINSDINSVAKSDIDFISKNCNKISDTNKEKGENKALIYIIGSLLFNKREIESIYEALNISITDPRIIIERAYDQPDKQEYQIIKERFDNIKDCSLLIAVSDYSGKFDIRSEYELCYARKLDNPPDIIFYNPNEKNVENILTEIIKLYQIILGKNK